MEKLHFAIIGCGRIAERHAEIINKIGKLNAVCDIKAERAKLFSEKYSCHSFKDLPSLLNSKEKIDFISICTPNYIHSEQTILALNSGKHVLCEKPMALSVDECKKMIDASKSNDKKLFIVKQNRFNPPIEALKKLISDGTLGKIIGVDVNCFWNRNEQYYSSSDWKGKKKLDGGTLFTQFSHFIDLVYWLAGDVVKANALGKNFLKKDLIEFEDSGVAILEFKNGAIGSFSYTVNSFGKNMEGSITIFGEKGTVKVGGQYLNVLEYQNIEGKKIEGLPESRPANDYGFYQGSMSNHDKVYQNVIEVMQGKSEIAANANDGLKTVEIIEMIYKSMQGNLL